MQDVKIDTQNSGNYSSPFINSHESSLNKGGKEGCSGRNKYFGKFVLMVFVTSCVVILFSSIINKTRQERIHMLEAKKLLEKQASELGVENVRLGNEYSA